MKIIMYADGNYAFEAPLANLPICFSMMGLMQAELMAQQIERTRREGGQVLLPGGMGDIVPPGPQG